MNTSLAPSTALAHERGASAVISLLGAVLLGAVIVFATGFSNAGVVHNAAHDMRHANAFPCH